MIARLFNAPMHDAEEEALGCSTVGSSEAIILATLAMKRRWQNARKAKGLSTEKPNMVLGANCQVAWHKALLYVHYPHTNLIFFSHTYVLVFHAGTLKSNPGKSIALRSFCIWIPRRLWIKLMKTLSVSVPFLVPR